jgi:hypothetical protein
VLERYELLYEAGLAPEAARDRGEHAPSPALAAAMGEPMISDHRRILATALSRLRGKLKYRPVVFELMPPRPSPCRPCSGPWRPSPACRCTSRTSAGPWSAPTGGGAGPMDTDTGGRPAELFRFRREILGARPVSGLSLPLLRD